MGSGSAWALLIAGSMGVWAQATHERTIEFGFEQRVRNENWNNITDFSDAANDQRNQVRFRSRAWVSAPLNSNITFYAGVDSETNKKKGVDLVADEVMVEALYVDIKRLFTPRLSLRAGRQNLVHGDGLILFDGDPSDGSRSLYFNAVDLTWSFRKSRLELIGIVDPATDHYLPRFHDQHRPLTEWNQQAVGAYYTIPFTKSSQGELYYFLTKQTGDCRDVGNRQYRPDRHLHISGGRFGTQWGRGWSATGELALQSGRQSGGAILHATAGLTRLRKAFSAKGQPYLQGGYVAFSGDDPSTKDRIEGWEPVFSRSAQWSEMYLYSFMPEKGIAYWTNMSMPQLEAGWSPRKPLSLRATYYHTGAFHPFGDSRFGSGTRRGPLVQFRGDIVVNQHWRGHVLLEHLNPGSFYAAKAPGYFLRFEVIFTTKGHWTHSSS